MVSALKGGRMAPALPHEVAEEGAVAHVTCPTRTFSVDLWLLAADHLG